MTAKKILLINPPVKRTVMDVLDYISLHLDPSLAYYKHSACDHGICGRCSVSINGKTRLACIEVVNRAAGCLFLAPVPGREPVRDLVTRQHPAGQKR